MTDSEHQLVDLYLDGSLPESERALLFQRLATDPEAMTFLAERSELHADLRRAFKRRNLRQLAVASAVTSALLDARERAPAPWFSWRPLTAAAAGLVIGLFSASMVFGLAVQHGLGRKTSLPVLEPSFEDAQMPLAKGFPPGPSLWTGDMAKVVTAENGVTPKDGHHMLRLETSAHGAPVLFPRLYQIIALPASGTERREIEVSASFTSADPDSLPHYTVRTYAVNEAPDRLGPDWFARHWFVEKDEAIASAATSFENPPGSTDWQSIGLRMQVPSKARCLVVFFGVKNLAKSQAKRPHYLDAVKMSLVESPPHP
jgi:hypothetical protein